MIYCDLFHPDRSKFRPPPTVDTTRKNDEASEWPGLSTPRSAPLYIKLYMYPQLALLNGSN